MATLESAKRKWERKTANAGPKWKASVTKEKYMAGMDEFGTPVGPMTGQNYADGVGEISAAEFQAAITGKGEKWARRLKEAVAV